ncbi:MAG: cytochrome c maturation protein CcmE [bacterium]|nr:cytochrome c maturation protein CcmE [bacterium]
MKNKKILIGSIVIVAAIIYLGVTGIEQDMSYYITAEELLEQGDQVFDTRLRVAGQVVWGSIDRSKKPMTFNIDHNNSVVTVLYEGQSPVPDTFKDHAQVVLEGKYSKDKIFRADKIQAKCASKYESRLEEAKIK